MQRLFLLAWSAVVILVIGLVSYLWVSLIPFFHQIGIAMTVLVIVAIGCAGILICVFTYSWAGILLSRRKQAALHSRLLVSGEVVVYPHENGTFTHLSAMHEAAKVIPQVALSKEQEPEPLPSEAYVVLDMHQHGIGHKKIADATKWTEYQVRKLCNQFDNATKSSK